MRTLLLQVFIFALTFAGNTSAHTVEQIYLSLEKAGHSLELNFTFDAAYSLPEFRADTSSPQPSREWLIQQSPEEHHRLRTSAEEYLRETFQIILGNKELHYQISFPDYSTDPPKFPSLLNGGAYFNILLTSNIPETQSGDINITVTDGEHPNFLIAIENSDQTNYIIVEPGKTEKLYSITSTGEIEHQKSTLSEIFWLGFRHVIPDGLDHILFIFGLFLMARKWKPLVAQSLTFTLAHSISLGLAASGIIIIQDWPGSELIEPIIALSIAVIALENIFFKQTKTRRLVLVFAFGLIHGLGFAGSLGVLLHHDDYWLLTLATANIGVEVAQVLLLAGAWILTIKWCESKHYPRFRIAASILIALIGLWWTAERLIS